MLYEIPFPPPGKLELSIPFGSFVLHCSRPPLNRCPLIKNYSTYALFCSLSIENIVRIFELLLSEYKLIFVSEHASMLNLAATAFTNWIYPFYWHHILIPVLPARLISFLQAPVPFLVGIEKASFPQWVTEDWKPADAAVIDLDIDYVDFPPLKDKISSRERKKLIQGLERYSGNPLSSKPDLPKASIPLHMQSAFPKDKLCLNSTQSVLDYRKIRDIPKIVYDSFRNSFLGEKCGKVVKMSSQTISTSVHMASQSFAQSFDSIARSLPSKPEAGKRFPLAPMITLQSDIDLGRDSFMAGEKPAENNSSKTPPIKTAPEDFLAQGPPTLEIPIVSPLTISPMFSPATASPAPKVQRTPSFFERLLNMGPTESAPSAKQSLETALTQDVPLVEYVQQTFEKVIYQDGHELHQLLCHLSTQVNIDNEDNDDYVDRFTTVSIDSDDGSRSESSTLNENKSTAGSVRGRGHRPSKTWEVFGRKKSEAPKIEKIRKICKPECALCCSAFDFRVDDAFMCKSLI